eukprot:scaffold161696_cov17-Tisochrysis_lutea.AAC.1
MENNSQFIIFRNRNADPQASSLQDEPSSDRCAVSQDSNMRKCFGGSIPVSVSQTSSTMVMTQSSDVLAPGHKAPDFE